MEKTPVDINHFKVEQYIERIRPRLEIRKELDFGFSFEKNCFILHEVRPIPLSTNSEEYRKYPFAKFRFIKSTKIWKLYWMRASGKWESYEPFPLASNVDDILKTIDEDKYGCFYG